MEVPERPKKIEKRPVEKVDGAKADSLPLELDPQPAYFEHRIQMYNRLKAQQDQEIAQKPHIDISITLVDGSVKTGQAWVTTPGDIARSISKSLFERTVVARVNGELRGLGEPLEGDCKLELLDFDHPEGQKVFWHSSAHILGEAAERRFAGDLCIGPPVDDGFYYEMALPDNGVVQQADWKPLETIAAKIVKEKQPFERLTLSKKDLLEMFKSNKYKQHIISDKIPDGSSTTVYRCGSLIDLCRGPHVPHTGYVKAFQIMKNSASYFLGDAKNDSLQRIYGVSFPDKKRLDEHKKYLEEAAKRDHRKIGQEQELFFFHGMSPGSCFFLPHGTIIYNALLSFLKSEYWKRGYQEVMTPNMYNSDLWKRSGHWQHYKDDMFTFEVEKDQWALKPMNCPGHCLIFGHRDRSYRELPMRIADFGVLHRNEASGALSGLTRVRRFQQDDTHIFCMEEQIEQEILGLFDFLDTVYGQFGFKFKMKLSTRPEKFLGEVATWDQAEGKLRSALDAFTAKEGVKWETNPGDGAFYGPKIDITISDALKRDYQCATIQLDFQLPQQFNLEFVTAETSVAKPKTENEDATPHNHKHNEAHAHAHAPTPPKVEDEDARPNDPNAMQAQSEKQEKTHRKELTPGCARPVMIHRAIYGSFERFIAILTEHFGGKWPFWLSPRQILVIPVMPAANDYVLEVQRIFRDKGMHADVDVSGQKMAWKIRNGQLKQYNFIFVVGAQEQETRTVNIRDRDDPATQAKGEMVKLEDAISKMETLRETRALAKVVDVMVGQT